LRFFLLDHFTTNISAETQVFYDIQQLWQGSSAMAI